MSDRPLRLGALLAVWSILAAACPGESGREEARPGRAASFELQIGAVLMLTGVGQPSGERMDLATGLAAELIQASLRRLGLSNRISVSIRTEDDETRPTSAVEAATKLVQVHEVSVIVGPQPSTFVLPVAQSVTIPNGVPLITASATAAAISELEDAGLVWRTAPSDLLQARVLARAMAESFGADAVVNTGALNEAYGAGLVEAFERRWTAGGGTIGSSVRWNPDAPTFDTEAGELVEGDPDAWLMVDFPTTWARVGPALVRTGRWDPGRTFTADSLHQPTLPELVGAQATEGMRGTRPTAGGPSLDDFDREWKARTQLDRFLFEPQMFDAVMLAFLAATAARSSEPEGIASRLASVSGPPGPRFPFMELDAAVSALLAGRDIDYQGVSGPIDFDRNGDPSAAFYEVWQFRQGELVALETFPLETA